MTKCAALKYVVEGYAVKAYDVGPSGSFRAGSLYLRRDNSGMAEYLRVESVNVMPSYQRCGVGTQLYTRAAELARELKMPLYSDTARTAASQGFWEKQERKGRAKCAKKGRGAAKINMNHASGAVIEERGRWACQEYVLKPTATDLSGLKRKPARKGAKRRKGSAR